MGIIDDLNAEVAAAKPTKCHVARVLATCNAKDRADWEKALADRAYNHTMILAVIRRIDPNISVGSISRHRRGICSCAG